MKRLYDRLMEKPEFDRAGRMQALTDSEAEQCRRFGIQAPAAVLPNGVDLQVIDASNEVADLRRQLHLPPNEKLLLFLSRIFPKKGLDLLARAFGRLVSQRPDVTLLIAGPDAGTGYRDEVAAMLRDAGAEAKSRFLGELRGDRKFQVLRGVDLFVLPSYSEGLPVAVLEAMATSRPVVITPGCNIPEVQESQAGWITPPQPDELYRTLDEALGDPVELCRRGRNARNLVEQRFTWESIAQQSIGLYAQAGGRVFLNPEGVALKQPRVERRERSEASRNPGK